MKLLVPAYIYPHSDPSTSGYKDWQRILAVHRDLHGIIVNVNSGPGPVRRDVNYVKLIDTLDRLAVRVYGYVASDYGRTYGVDQCIDHVDKWREQWGIDDIFVDEVASDAAKLGFYATLNAYVRGDVVLNHGTKPDARYVKCGAMLCTAETELGAYNGRAFETFDVVQRARLYHIIMGVPSTMIAPVLVKAARYATYVYVTDQVEPRAFTQLPAYFERLVATLRATNIAT